MLDHTSLTLWFSRDEQGTPHLIRSLFVDPSHSNVAACRFESCIDHPSSVATIRNVLASLFVRASVSGEFGDLLSGCSGSSAASLEYACRTNSKWIVQMFGRAETGQPRYEHLIRRERAANTIEVSLYELQLAAEQIRIIRDDKLIDRKSELLKLAAVLRESSLGENQGKKISTKLEVAGNLRSSKAQEDSPQQPLADSLPYQTLFTLFERELHSMLWQTNIFSTIGKRKLLYALRDEPAFLRNCKSPLAATSEIDLKLSQSAQLGCVSPNICANSHKDLKPIRIAVPADLVGSVAILRYLQKVRNFPVEIDLNYSHSPEIVDTVFAERFITPPDGLILSAPAASRVISAKNRTGYTPLMFTPGLSRRVVAPIGASQVGDEFERGCFLCLSESLSVSGSYFDALGQKGALRNSSIVVKNSEPHESTEALSSGDSLLRAIFVFPHYDLNTIFNNCRVVDTTNRFPTISQSILFLSKQLMNDSFSAELLNIAIRGAWLELRESAQARSTAIELLLGDPEYLRLIERFCGLHQLNVRCLEETQTRSTYVELSSNRYGKRSPLHSCPDWAVHAGEKNLVSTWSRIHAG